ncbi:MAG: manganese efflux pump MntP family protein [Proteobacteria bacterium]|nr:manganese efflux pump MntP family protein [Pseudomonadota bacterium]
MSFGAIVVLALGLAMDATAAAAARGSVVSRLRLTEVLLVALVFGGFQAGMPLIGWVVGAQLGDIVERWDHWIAFGLLSLLGAKMIWESLGDTEKPEKLGLWTLLGLAIATSIDALAVGVTLPIIHAPVALTVVTIGVVTALASAAGMGIGRRFGAALGKRFDLVGGLALIGLGTKILVDHLTA